MDFADIATATSQAVRYGSRMLLETGTAAAEDAGDAGTTTTKGSGSGIPTQTSPFMSPAAEAELFLLATNFLLYVAMVIITTIVAKIYFPESLTRGGNANSGMMSFHNSPSSSGSGHGHGHHHNHVSVDLIDDDDDDSSDDDSDEKDSDDSDDSDDSHNERESLLLDLEYEADGVAGAAAQKKQRKKKALSPTSAAHAERQRSFPINLEFDQEHTSKAVVMKRLMFCAVVLNITFIAWGVLQVRTSRSLRTVRTVMTVCISSVSAQCHTEFILYGLFVFLGYIIIYTSSISSAH
jgi:hypothetical protein